MEVAALAAVTVTPTTAAPEVSRTVPVTLAVCARSIEGAESIPRMMKKVPIRAKRRCRRFMPIPLSGHIPEKHVCCDVRLMNWQMHLGSQKLSEAWGCLTA